MHHHTRRLLPATTIALAALATAALVPAAASAQAPAATGASAKSNAADGMTYLGGSANNDVRIRLAGTTFTIDDIVPIQAGAGCAPVTGDNTKVTCTAFKDGTKFKQFFVNAQAGNNTVINQTNSGASGAPMFALGSTGKDVLIGGDGPSDLLKGSSGDDTLRGGNETGTEHDVLEGGSGNDTLAGGAGSDELDGGTGDDNLDGGDGGDVLDGGFGNDRIDGGLLDTVGWTGADTVAYDRVTPVVVDMRRTSPQGSTGENDTFARVENVRGGDGDDWITGNQFSNTLFGGLGDDTLDGQDGRDTLFGNDGNDVLVPSFNADGVVDFLDCDGFRGDDDDDPNDLAFRFPADGDIVQDCEQVLDL